MTMVRACPQMINGRPLRPKANVDTLRTSIYLETTYINFIRPLLSVLETPGFPVTGTPSIYLAFYSIYNIRKPGSAIFIGITGGDPSLKELCQPFKIDGEPVTGIPGDSWTDCC